MGLNPISVLGQKMAQNFKDKKENGTKSVPKCIWEVNLCDAPIGHVPTEHAPMGHVPNVQSVSNTYGWRAQNRLSDFVRIILGFSPEENAVLDAVRAFQMPKTAARIAKTAGVNRKMTNRILKAFEARQLVVSFEESGKRDRWRYNRKVGRL